MGLAMTSADPGLASFAAAMHAFAVQDFEHAAQHAGRAAELSPASRVFREAARYLDRVRRDGKRDVYIAPDAFSAFIRGGGNRRLYERTSAALRAAYREHAAAALLDIGAGDGLALLPALAGDITSVTIIDPSAALLATAATGVQARGVRCEALCATAQDVPRIAAGRRWDLVQATFSLQCVPPADRPALWAALRRAAGRLLIVEFDVPQFDTALSPDHIRHVVDRYERGLAEYDGDGGLVAQGFLLPVLCGYFDPTAARSNYEQPIAAWIAELRVASYTATARPLDDYWWATAQLIDADPAPAR
jgi:ubiquinone/menaquinone biosynthesis C-methylase UbiE